MKKFLKNTILFSIIVITTSYVLDFYISYKLRPNGEFYSWNDIFNNKVNSEIVIFGSSRALNHFDPNSIEKSLDKSTYNLGLSNAHTEISYYRLLELLKNCSIKPKIVTLEVSYLTLDNSRSLWSHFQLFPFMLFNKDCYECTKDLKGFNKYNFVFPLVRYSGNLKQNYQNSLLKDRNSKTNKGYVGFSSNFNYKDFQNKINENFCENHPIDTLRINFLNKFVSLCKTESIKLNFVYSPELYQGRKFVENREEIISFFQNYADSLNIPFKDFSNDIIFNSDTANFFNVQHLNKRGAEKFTSEYYVPWLKELYGL